MKIKQGLKELLRSEYCAYAFLCALTWLQTMLVHQSVFIKPSPMQYMTESYSSFFLQLIFLLFYHRKLHSPIRPWSFLIRLLPLPLISMTISLVVLFTTYYIQKVIPSETASYFLNSTLNILVGYGLVQQAGYLYFLSTPRKSAGCLAKPFLMLSVVLFLFYIVRFTLYKNDKHEIEIILHFVECIFLSRYWLKPQT